MTFRELLDVPFALIQQNLAAVLLLSVATFLLAECAVIAVTGGVAVLTDGSDQGTAWAAVLATAAAIWLARFVLRGTTVPIGLAAVAGAPIGWRTALRRFGAVCGPLLLFQVVYTLIGLGVLALTTPLIISAPFGLAWLAWLRARQFVAVPVLFGEPSGYRVAVARAKLLADGADWQTAWLWICQRCLFVLLAVPLLGIPWYLSDFSGTRRWPVIVLLTGGVLLIVVFAEVVESATRVVSYIDRRCRREGLDIHVPQGPVR